MPLCMYGSQVNDASRCLRVYRITIFRPITRECTRLYLSAVNLVFLHLHKPLISLFCNFPSSPHCSRALLLPVHRLFYLSRHLHTMPLTATMCTLGSSP